MHRVAQRAQVKLDNAGAPPRCYSIAGAPRSDGEILLHVSRDVNGAPSRWLHDKVLIGDMVKLAGHYGNFIGDPSVETSVLCLAAGSGLAPILSLTEAALRRGFKKPVRLMFSARTAQDVYDRGRFCCSTSRAWDSRRCWSKRSFESERA